MQSIKLLRLVTVVCVLSFAIVFVATAAEMTETGLAESTNGVETNTCRSTSPTNTALAYLK